jgi:diguanylate cyclase (GGDEF)-like protein
MKTVTLSRTTSDLIILAGLAAIYFVAGKVGLRLAFVNASATPVWPSAGIGLAAFLLLGYRVWPAILLSAFLVNVTTAGSVASSVAIALGNTLEGIVGAYLVNRYANGRECFDRPRDIFRFAGLVAVVSATISATWGATTLSLTGSAHWTEYGSIWLTWWLGDAAADLVVTPVLVLWSQPGRHRWQGRQLLETAVLLALLVLVSQLVFGGLFPDKNYPLDFLCVPFLMWAALRFEPREAAAAVLLLAGIAVRGSLWGYGPFVRGTQNESLLLLQAFMGVVSLMTLTMAAVVSARRRTAERLRLMSVTDPLTGLANYRQLLTTLGGEIRRSVRTGRPFAVLFLDLDRLKRINDRYGHLVGSRAICRVGEVLRHSCRAIDTAARYGGDEFALILPETGEADARLVTVRIAERLEADREEPAITVSVGLALFPRDGETVEMLLGAADRHLYEAKALPRTIAEERSPQAR